MDIKDCIFDIFNDDDNVDFSSTTPFIRSNCTTNNPRLLFNFNELCGDNIRLYDEITSNESNNGVYYWLLAVYVIMKGFQENSEMVEDFKVVQHIYPSIIPWLQMTTEEINETYGDTLTSLYLNVLRLYIDSYSDYWEKIKGFHYTKHDYLCAISIIFRQMIISNPIMDLESYTDMKVHFWSLLSRFKPKGFGEDSNIVLHNDLERKTNPIVKCTSEIVDLNELFIVDFKQTMSNINFYIIYGDNMENTWDMTKFAILKLPDHGLDFKLLSNNPKLMSIRSSPYVDHLLKHFSVVLEYGMWDIMGDECKYILDYTRDYILKRERKEPLSMHEVEYSVIDTIHSIVTDQISRIQDNTKKVIQCEVDVLNDTKKFLDTVLLWRSRLIRKKYYLYWTHAHKFAEFK